MATEQSPFPRHSGIQRQNGFALLFVLIMLVLILGVTLAFFSRAALHRNTSQSSASQVQVERFAAVAEALVISDLVDEISAGSAPDPMGSGAKYSILRPLPAGASSPDVFPSMSPQRTGDNGIANIVKRSTHGQPAYSQIPGYSRAGMARASAVSTETPSMNQRRIARDSWNAPKLMTDADLAMFESPDWIYVDREGATPVDFSPSAIATMLPDSLANPRAVIGRFAYVVYDVGGLIDVLSAGNTLTGTLTSARGRLHHVSLANGIGGVPTPAFADFVRWRSPHTSAWGATAEEYDADSSLSEREKADRKRFGLFSPHRSHAGIPSILVSGKETSEQTFSGRQDLIAFAGRTGSPIPPEALPYLTTFSRDVNAPSYMPPSTRPTIAARYFEAGSTPQAELNPDLLGTAVRYSTDVVLTRPEGQVRAPAGTPVMGRRFPLQKISLLSEDNPDPEELLYYFGLEKRPDGAFVYAARLNDRLASLMSVAEFRGPDLVPDPDGSGAMLPTAREPNFFETLQAVIAAGSLGKTAGSPKFNAPELAYGVLAQDNTAVVAHDADNLRNRQVMQIGANIIDQWDRNDIPTTIYYPRPLPLLFPADPLDERNFLSTYGVENLPYITQFTLVPHRPNYSIDGTAPRDFLRLWAVFDVWNPHQNAKAPEGIERFRIVSPYGRGTLGANYYFTLPFGSSFYFNPLLSDGTLPADNWQLPSPVPPGASPNAIRSSTPGGGCSYMENLPRVPWVDGLPSRGTTVQSLIKDLNDNRDFELSFLPGPYVEPTTIGSGEPSSENDVPGVLLGDLNLSLVDGVTTPRIPRHNAAVPPKSGRTRNMQLTLNYLMDSAGMHPYTAQAGDGTNIRILTTTARSGNHPQVGTSVLATTGESLETQGPGGERIYPAGTVFSNLDTTAWNVSPPLGAGNTAAAPTTVYANFGVKAHNYARYYPNTGNEKPTFDLQALVNGQWITYQRIEGWYQQTPTFSYIGADDSKASAFTNTHHSAAGFNASSRFYPWKALPVSMVKSDPRTGRFGMSYTEYDAGGVFLRSNSGNWNGTRPAASDPAALQASRLGWISLVDGRFPIGRNLTKGTPAGFSAPVNAPGFEHFWPTQTAPYGLVSNHPGNLDAANPMRYSDIDEVIRPADGYWGAKPTIPVANGGQLADRPLILNRPFHSVGELGHVFRDTPWKTLDFATAASGDNGLLDVFSLDETTAKTPVTSGTVNLNTRQRATLVALLQGAGRSQSAVLSDADAGAIADAVIAQSTAAPFLTRSDLVSRDILSQVLGQPGVSGMSPGNMRKAEREAAIRALTEAGTTRTWNFLVDIVAQTGRFTRTSVNASQFVVHGGHRRWLHIAIDRLTGQVIAREHESINE